MEKRYEERAQEIEKWMKSDRASSWGQGSEAIAEEEANARGDVTVAAVAESARCDGCTRGDVTVSAVSESAQRWIVDVVYFQPNKKRRRPRDRNVTLEL